MLGVCGGWGRDIKFLVLFPKKLPYYIGRINHIHVQTQYLNTNHGFKLMNIRERVFPCVEATLRSEEEGWDLHWWSEDSDIEGRQRGYY